MAQKLEQREQIMVHVRYVEGCSSSLKSFTTRDKAMKFVSNFLLKYQFEKDDNWVDLIVEGTIIYNDPSVGA